MLELRGYPLESLLLLFSILSFLALLIFLLKPKRRRVVIPSTVLWEELRLSRVRRILKDLPLFLLQVVVLLLLTLSLGNPEWKEKGRGGEDGREPEDIIFLIDNSPSMDSIRPDGERRVEDARRKVSRLMDHLAGKEGELPLFPLHVEGGRWIYLAPPSPGIEVTPEGGLRDALDLALSSTKHGRGKVFLFSDREETPESALPEGYSLYRAGVGEDQENAGIVDFSIAPIFHLPPEMEVLVRLKNFGEGDVHITLSFETEGAVVGRSEISLPPSADVVKFFRLNPLRGEYLCAILKGRGRDPFPHDDIACLPLPALGRPRILLVTGGNPYLEKGLSSMPGVRVDIQGPEEGRKTLERGGRGYDILFLDGLIPPYPLASPAVFMNPPPEPPYFSLIERVDFPIFTFWEGGSPFLKNLVIRELNLKEGVVLALAEGAGGRLHGVAGSLDKPLLFEGEINGMRVFVMGFDIRKSDLPLKVAFPQLLYNAIVTLWGEEERDAPLPRGHPLNEPIFIKRGRGDASISVIEGVDGGRGFLDIPERGGPFFLPHSGVFRVRDGDGIRILPVNLLSERESREASSRVEGLTAEEVLKLIEGGGKGGGKSISRPLLPPFLISSILLILLELTLFRII